MSPYGIAVCFFLPVCFLFYIFNKLHKIGPYPPGPTPHPLVGHVFQVPPEKTWKYFEELFRTYGPITHLSLAGDHIIVLSDPSDAEELLGRRSNNYSSRKQLIYGGKYQSNNKRFVMLPYGPTLKKHRMIFTQMLQPRRVGGYESSLLLESVRLLHDMLLRPAEWSRNCERFSASLVFKLSYGKRLEEEDENFNGILSVLKNLVTETYPGAHLVDTFPILDALPDFLAPWRVRARKNHAIEMNLYGRLVLDVKRRMDEGDTTLECLAARLWDRQHDMDLDLEERSYIAGMAFEAGTDTTSATIQWFFMAMVLYPQCLKNAQAEIDSVVGGDGRTIPGFEHIDSLPYCVALTKEVFRWAPAVPGGFPHTCDSDDEYKGYKIHAKTLVIPCIWTMHHNEDVYPNSYAFTPERFLQEGTRTTLADGHYGFGFGRRKCPGQYLASKSVWIAVTRLMWAFDIGPEFDELGNRIPVDPANCTSGVTSKPLTFPLRLTPRSTSHSESIMVDYIASG